MACKDSLKTINNIPHNCYTSARVLVSIILPQNSVDWSEEHRSRRSANAECICQKKKKNISEVDEQTSLFPVTCIRHIKIYTWSGGIGKTFLLNCTGERKMLRKRKKGFNVHYIDWRGASEITFCNQYQKKNI